MNGQRAAETVKDSMAVSESFLSVRHTGENETHSSQLVKPSKQLIEQLDEFLRAAR